MMCCYNHIGAMPWRWVTSTLASDHPQLPRIRYRFIITAVNG